jgi:hypothetical protein
MQWTPWALQPTPPLDLNSKGVRTGTTSLLQHLPCQPESGGRESRAPTHRGVLGRVGAVRGAFLTFSDAEVVARWRECVVLHRSAMGPA